MRFHVPVSAALLCVLPAVGHTQDLGIGDPAPALKIARWVKGEPVESFEPGKAYVVEFWATWCGPCIASMPHLTEIQEHHADQGLTVIGVTSEDARGNTLDKVEAMVEEKGDGMGYTVAWDEGRETNAAYMKAAGQGGIPCSFLVDTDGKIAYIGHPMWLDIPIEAVLAGTWNAKEGAKKIKAAEDRLMKIYANRDDPAAQLEKLDEFLTEYPSLHGMLSGMRYNLLLATENYEQASDEGAKIVAAAIEGKDAMKLNQIAWGIVDPEADVEKRDIDLAMRAAGAAVKITKEKDANILDTLARAYAWKKDYAKAIELQTAAVKIDSRLEPALEEYQKKLAEKKRGEAVESNSKKGK